MSLISVLFSCLLAAAQVFVEPAVLQNLGTQSDTRVLLVFESQVAKPSNPHQKAADFQLSMRSESTQRVNQLRSDFPWLGSRQVEALWILNSVTVRVDNSELEQLLKAPGLQSVLWADKPIKVRKTPEPLLNKRMDFTYGLKKLNIPEVRQKYPHLLGTGVRVGILDTGIYDKHPDLQGRLLVYRNFSPDPSQEPGDGFNHGTHVAGTIAGGGHSRKFIGVAPEADLIVGRIFDRYGSSSRQSILESMQWMADPDGDPQTDDRAHVVNSSWSDDDPYVDRLPENEPFCQIIDRWLAMNIVPVFSAGNSGPRDGTIHLPGGCPGAFSVGASTINDRSPYFSSTGPARWQHKDLMKPEVVAPGFKVYSARSGGGYEEMSGTSMAAPHVAGAFAILIQEYPNVGVQKLLEVMIEGAKELGAPGQDKVFGWGRIDVLKSLELLEQQGD